MKQIFQSYIFPRPEEDYSPKEMCDQGLEMIQGERANHWLRPAKNPEGVFVFLHGNGDSAFACVDFANEIAGYTHWSVLLFEYPGYADFEEPFAGNESELVEEVCNVTACLREHKNCNKLPLVLWGCSLGGGVAASAARSCEPDGLILESTFTSLAEAAKGFFPGSSTLAKVAGASYRFNTVNNLMHAVCPLLIAHSPEDDYFGYDHADRMFETARCPKLRVKLQGDHHDEKHNQKPFRQGVARLLKAAKAYKSCREILR